MKFKVRFREGIDFDAKLNGVRTILVDQTFSPTSKNAQSGIAVAEAFDKTALKGAKSGTAVALCDVSRLEHILGVKARSENVFDINRVEDIKEGGAYIEVNGNDIVFTYGTTGTNYFAFACWVDVDPYTDYTVSLKSTSIDRYYVYTDYIFGTTLAVNVLTTGGTFNSGNNNRVLIGFYSIQPKRAGTSEVISEIMINEGKTAKPYVPYADISTAKVQRYRKNLAQVNSATLPADNGKILFEGKITGDFVFSYKNNLAEYVAGAAVIAVTVNGITQTVGYSTAEIYRISGTLTRIKIVNYGSATGSMDNIQLEVGTLKPAGDNRYTKTDFEPYREPTSYSISEGGIVEGVTSLYPTTTLMSDTEGIVLDVEYNRDINKAFAELQNALISTGGNV